MAETTNALPSSRAVMVIGAGTMGCGIAEVAASAGHRVILRDAQPAALDRGLAQIAKSLDRRVERGRLAAPEREAILQRLAGDAPLADVGLVIEVIVEKLDVKIAVLREVEAQVPADAIIASNTSSLSITAIAGGLQRPERVAGMHFFNPAPVLPLVEVVRGHATDGAVVHTLVDTARAWGKVPVVCQSTPGFIVNRVARPYYAETLRLLQEQAATPATLDAVMRDCGGFRMGPCELMDLIGHDVNFAVTASVHDGFFGDSRYRPSLVQQALVHAGWLGRKSGRGFYDYRDGAAASVADTLPALPAPQRVVIEGHLGPAEGWRALLRACPGLQVDEVDGDGLLRVDGVALALSDGRTATRRSTLAGEPVLLFDLVLDIAACPRVALAVPAQASAAQRDGVAGVFTALGKQVSVLADRPGLAVTRTVAMLVNEAADAVLHGLASPSDVDAAMQKGVNYPIGPLAWAQRLGHGWVAQVLSHLAEAYGEDRYRVSLWLQEQECVHG